ncbi:YlzJ-like family protein [Neobacillus thermocopriae]|uniref:Ribonuclease n=1 Tax=Neobacillus thermocopriae TaxID=1215031 RepID=A0A6B3TN83_9BACI|nr:YlzJ-like family protein [Neobacillus thermocopriae]MED3624205.1 YlzJ-like family protein [Neobacillus thermocopriae]MED3713600.1 YlzJ-like family protein [Neobacillus thermocopriae]NEX77710.1 ribonuclease [Neobacillus thermocopriae]
MILYTMMPHELIFPYDGNAYEKQQMVSYQGIPLLVEPVDQQNVQVLRILSSDPQHYLHANLSPGSKISFSNLDPVQ